MHSCFSAWDFAARVVIRGEANSSSSTPVMKTHFSPLTLTLLSLLLSAALHAQNAPASARAGDPSATPAVKSPGPAIAKVLLLASGPLGDVIMQIESNLGEFRDSEGVAPTMPNILFGPGAEKLVLAADLRLRDVTPVQALTLVAAASGCTLQPIPAPKESADSPRSEDRIIGWQFMVHPSRTQYGYTGTRSALPKPAPAKQVQESSLTVLDAKPRPEPTTIGGAFGAAAQKSTDIYGAGAVAGGMGSDDAMRGIAFIAPVAADTPTVRIYALGSVMRGGASEMKEQEVGLQTLLAEALDHAKLGGEAPVLSFHSASKALIVKGTAAQHDIVTQILTAMKENDSANPNKIGEPIIPR
jgi:hypothetical protein